MPSSPPAPILISRTTADRRHSTLLIGPPGAVARDPPKQRLSSNTSSNYSSVAPDSNDLDSRCTACSSPPAPFRHVEVGPRVRGHSVGMKPVRLYLSSYRIGADRNA